MSDFFEDSRAELIDTVKGAKSPAQIAQLLKPFVKHGAIHEFHLEQFELWPLIWANGESNPKVELAYDTTEKYVEYNYLANPPNLPYHIYQGTEATLKDLLTEDWRLIVLFNQEVLYPRDKWQIKYSTMESRSLRRRKGKRTASRNKQKTRRSPSKRP